MCSGDRGGAQGQAGSMCRTRRRAGVVVGFEDFGLVVD
jgi:hypothetical protein